jgi:hypothetical protein
LLLREQEVDCIRVDDLEFAGVNTNHGAYCCTAAAEQGHGVAAGGAIVIAVDQAAEGVFKARGGLGVASELDGFG